MSEVKREGRRVFLTGGLVGAAAGVVGATGAGVFGDAQRKFKGSAVTGERIEWRLASSFPDSLDTIFGAAEVLAERVAAMTGGAFTITPYQSGEIVPGLQVLDAVQRGSVEVGQSAGYYYIGKCPALAFDTCLPFGFSPRMQNAWLHEAGGLEKVRAIYADFNVITFPCGNTGAQMGGWFKRPVETLQDLHGLVMRIPGLGGKVMAQLGVNAQMIPGGEIYQALERGAIDAAEWVGPYDDEKLDLHRAAKNYYYPGWWEPGPSLSFMVGLDAWASLPSLYQEIFRAASAEAAAAMQQRYDRKNPAAFARLRASGVTVRPFSDEIMRGARDAARQLAADEAAQDATYRDLLAHWEAFRDESFAWFGTCELAYARFAWG